MKTKYVIFLIVFFLVINVPIYIWMNLKFQKEQRLKQQELDKLQELQELYIAGGTGTIFRIRHSL